jgi:integrase
MNSALNKGDIFGSERKPAPPSRSECEAMAKRRHQCPTPFKHGNFWVINYREDVFEDGRYQRKQKQQQLAPETAKLREVLKLRDEFMAPFNHGSITAGSAVNFRDYVQMVYNRNKLPLLEASSQGRYEGVLDNYLVPEFGDKMLRDLTYDTVSAFFTRLAVKPVEIAIGKRTEKRILTLESRHKIWTVFSSVMSAAVQAKHLHANPADGIDLGSDLIGKRVKPFLTPRQFHAVLQIMPEPYATMVYVSVFTGLRVSELAGLRWRNIDGRVLTIEQKFCRGHWGAPKSDASNATIIVANSVIQRIFALKEITVSVRAGWSTRVFKAVKSDGPNDLVFQGVHRGGPLNDGNVLRRHIKPAGIKVGAPHANWLALRRSTATWHKKAGTHVKDTQRLMRHENAQTTIDIYTQLEYETQVEAVDQFEKFFRQETEARVN